MHYMIAFSKGLFPAAPVKVMCGCAFSNSVFVLDVCSFLIGNSFATQKS